MGNVIVQIDLQMKVDIDIPNYFLHDQKKLDCFLQGQFLEQYVPIAVDDHITPFDCKIKVKVAKILEISPLTAEDIFENALETEDLD